MQERDHRRYSPSQAERNFTCRGSTNLLRRVPARPSGPYAMEGTDAHDVFAAALLNNVRDAKEAHENWSSLFFEDLDDGKNNFYFAIQVALDYVFDILDTYPDAQMWVEKYVTPPTDNAPGEAAGYCDVAISIPSQGLLIVIDYKHGAGIAKEADCKQVKQYAAGFLFDEASPVAFDAVNSVELVIVQPRAFHKDGPIREVEITPFELYEYLQELDDMIGEAEDPAAPLNPGPWCDEEFCAASPWCPAREAHALQVASPTFKQIQDVRQDALPMPQHLDVQRLGQIRFHASTLRKWLDAVEQYCDELAREGYAVPGAKLVEAQARREYYGNDREVAAKLAALLGEREAKQAMAEYEALMKRYPVLDRIWRNKIIPITEAEKLVVEEYKRRVGRGRGRKKKAAEAGKQSFAYLTLKKSSGKLVLVDEDDPRPAVNKAKATFGHIGNLIAPPKGD